MMAENRNFQSWTTWLWSIKCKKWEIATWFSYEEINGFLHNWHFGKLSSKYLMGTKECHFQSQKHMFDDAIEPKLSTLIQSMLGLNNNSQWHECTKFLLKKIAILEKLFCNIWWWYKSEIFRINRVDIFPWIAKFRKMCHWSTIKTLIFEHQTGKNPCITW